jgi:hypothetical protein
MKKFFAFLNLNQVSGRLWISFLEKPVPKIP